ncbi:MAG: hypothetical protein QXT64_03005 [Desulfurococcaceae archaeon]
MLRSVAVLITLLAVFASASTPSVEEIRDYYDDGLCACATSGYIEDGALVIHRPGNATGYAVYSSTLPQVEEVILKTSLFIGNGSVASVWITPSFNGVPQTIDLTMYASARGVIVSVTNDMYVVGISNVNAITRFTVLATGALGFSNYRSLTVYVARISEHLSYLEVYIDGYKVYSSTEQINAVQFHEPRSVAILGGSARALDETRIDYTIIVFNSVSSKFIKAPELEMEILRLLPSVGVFIHNRTHLIVSYSCFYAVSRNECKNYTLVIYDAATGSEIATVHLSPDDAWEPISNVLVITDYVNVSGFDTINIDLLEGESVVASGMISMPKASILYQNEYTAILVTLIPVAIVVALVIKTGSMTSVGLGMVASGIIIILLPWIGLTFVGVYALGLLLLMMGILVLTLYRS